MNEAHAQRIGPGMKRGRAQRIRLLVLLATCPPVLGMRVTLVHHDASSASPPPGITPKTPEIFYEVRTEVPPRQLAMLQAVTCYPRGAPTDADLLSPKRWWCSGCGCKPGYPPGKLKQGGARHTIMPLLSAMAYGIWCTRLARACMHVRAGNLCRACACSTQQSFWSSDQGKSLGNTDSRRTRSSNTPRCRWAGAPRPCAHSHACACTYGLGGSGSPSA